MNRIPNYFPFYDISSPIVKSALGIEDRRTLIKRFTDAGIEIVKVGSMKCVRCEDLLKVLDKTSMESLTYHSIGKHSQDLSEFE